MQDNKKQILENSVGINFGKGQVDFNKNTKIEK